MHNSCYFCVFFKKISGKLKARKTFMETEKTKYIGIKEMEIEMNKNFTNL